MTKHKTLAKAGLPLLLIVAVCLTAGCKNDATTNAASLDSGAGSGTKVAVLPAGSKDPSPTIKSTGAPTSKTPTTTRTTTAGSAMATGTTAGAPSTAGSPTTAGQPLSQVAPGAPTGATPNTGDPASGTAAGENSMEQLLNPTPEQKAREKAIVDDANHKMTILRSQQTLSPQEKMKQYQAIHESAHRNLMALLTPEQRSKLAAQQEEQMQLASGRIVSDLDQGVHLNPVQKSKLTSLIQSTMKQERALVDNDALPMNQKQASVQSLRQSVTAQMQALLTPRQLNIVKAINAQAMAAARARAGNGQQAPPAMLPR